VAALRGRISGLCQPDYVLDIPGGYGKAPLSESAAQALSDQSWRVTDYNGGVHNYADPRKA
jgi:lysine 2,3-aminomutase